MTVLAFLVSKEYGCCTTAELMGLSKTDKPTVEVLKEWAKEEMKKRGIEIT